MTLYFAWVQEDQAFSAPKHTRHDETLFDCTLSEQEGEFPTAALTIKNPRAGFLHIYPDRKAYISWKTGEGKVQLLFSGRVIGLPILLEDECVQLELIAQPLEVEENLKNLPHKNHKLFQALSIRDKVHLYQDAETSSLYCDRKTHELKKSDWFKGKTHLTLTPSHFHDSLQIEVKGEPYSAVKIRLSIQWIQRLRGIMNVGKIIANAFPNFAISSYTPLKITSQFPKSGQRFGRSGYWIVKSELKPFTPPRTASLGLYPLASCSFQIEGKKSKSFKRHWYRLDFWVGWDYQQKRHEEVELTLNHRAQALYPRKGPEKTLEIRLQNPHPKPEGRPWLPGLVYYPGSKVWNEGKLYECQKEHFSHISIEENIKEWKLLRKHEDMPDEGKASFFLSEEGYEAVSHAAELAKWHLAKSARCVKVHFSGLWQDLSHLTTDMSVTLKDPRLPGGEIDGKITTLKITANGQTGERFVKVSLTCAIGEGEVEPVEEDGHSMNTPSGLVIRRYDDQPPMEGCLISPTNLVHHVDIQNGPLEQEAELAKHQNQGAKALTTALKSMMTRLRVKFVDLRSQEKLSHSIQATVLSNWSAPKQIDLSAEKRMS